MNVKYLLMHYSLNPRKLISSSRYSVFIGKAMDQLLWHKLSSVMYMVKCQEDCHKLYFGEGAIYYRSTRFIHS